MVDIQQLAKYTQVSDLSKVEEEIVVPQPDEQQKEEGQSSGVVDEHEIVKTKLAPP